MSPNPYYPHSAQHNGASEEQFFELGNRWDELQMNERNLVSPSPLNGERAGVRGESVEKALILQTLGELRPPHLTLPSPLPPGAERECMRPPVVYPAAQAVIHDKRADRLPSTRPGTSN